MCPKCPRKEQRTKSFRLQSAPSGKRPKVRPRARWCHYISDLTWSRLGVEPAELSEISVDSEVFWVLLHGLQLPRLSLEEKRARKRENKWMRRPTLNLSIYEIVFCLFVKSECRIQIIEHIWTETCVFVKMNIRFRHRRANDVDALKLHNDTL